MQITMQRNTVSRFRSDISIKTKHCIAKHLWTKAVHTVESSFTDILEKINYLTTFSYF